MPEQSIKQLDDEIGLRDITDFLIESWKMIIGVGLFGLLGAICFLVITPKQYEATAQIKMAQIAGKNNANSMTFNVEEPNLLIARLRLPSTYSSEEIKACGFQNHPMSAESILGISNFSILKGVDSVVELKIRMKSIEQAKICTQAIFENIRESQKKIIKPQIEGMKDVLTKYRQNLQELKLVTSGADKSEFNLSAIYLIRRDEVKYLTDEILRLNTFIAFSDLNEAKLISPIYVSEAHVYPSKKYSLINGLVVGLLIGFLLSMVKRIIAMYKK